MRKRIVSRTIMSTKVKALTVSVKSQKTEVQEFEIAGAFKSQDECLKQLKTVAETDDLKIVSVTEMDVQETLYGMEENEFLAHATKMDKRGTLPADTEVVETEPATEETLAK